MRGRTIAVFVAFCGLIVIFRLFVRPQNGAMLHDLVPMVTSVSPNTISDHANSSPEASQGLRSQSSATSEGFGSTYAENETERLSLKESFGFLRYSDEQWLRCAARQVCGPRDVLAEVGDIKRFGFDTNEFR